MIRIQKKPPEAELKTSRLECLPVLETACQRVQMDRCTIKADCSWQPELYAGPQVTQMFLILGEGGYITTETQAFSICEPALFVPPFDKEAVTIKAGREDLQCIRIISQMNQEDCNQILKSHMIFPRFRPFYQAWEYTMNIIDAPDSNVRAFMLIENRKLGANNMGIFSSAQPGASRILEDTLPTYDQFVIGLKGADCVLTVKGETTALKEGDIAFIPRKSQFSFQCNPEGMIHHVWYCLNRAYDE